MNDENFYGDEDFNDDNEVYRDWLMSEKEDDWEHCIPVEREYFNEVSIEEIQKSIDADKAKGEAQDEG